MNKKKNWNTVILLVHTLQRQIDQKLEFRVSRSQTDQRKLDNRHSHTVIWVKTVKICRKCIRCEVLYVCVHDLKN